MKLRLKEENFDGDQEKEERGLLISIWCWSLLHIFGIHPIITLMHLVQVR